LLYADYFLAIFRLLYRWNAILAENLYLEIGVNQKYTMKNI